MPANVGRVKFIFIYECAGAYARACVRACSNSRAKIILKNFQKVVDGQKKFLYSSGYGSKGSK